MVLKLKHRPTKAAPAAAPPKPTPTAFTTLVKEAVETTQKLNALRQTNAQKLTADAFLRETLALDPQSSLKQVAKLRGIIEGPTPGLNHVRAALRRMVRELRGLHFTRPPKEPRQFSAWLSNDATTAELTLLGASNVALLGVAVSICKDKHPEIFGTRESSAGLEEELAALIKKQAELLSQIPTSLTANDVDIGDTDEQGRAVVSFKVSNGQVPIGPPNNAGERLVNFLLANRRSI
jgi:hypothetical protein